ncbi:MAG: AAA family ATPase [Akkermansiaceae bacterium]
MSDGDLKRYLREAKAARDGRKDILPAGEAIELREDEWLWEGVIMRQATNMIFANPKVGKTRLMLAMLSEFTKGRGEFAGMALHPGPEKILLLGPDQSQRSWGNYLANVGLLTDDNRLPPSIVGMVFAESGFSLDEYWLSRVEEYLREHGPLVVLLDSYSAAIRQQGIDENKPEAVVPFQQLHNLCMAYDSTCIVIHHANKGGGDGDITTMARGSSAITAAADNLIGMRKWKGEEEAGLKKYELLVTGRAELDGVPLIGYAKHSAEWVSCGSAREAREEMTRDADYDGLTVPQLAALDALVTQFRAGEKAMTTKEVVAIAVKEPHANSGIAMAKVLNRLETLGFVQQEEAPKGTHYKQTKYWAPTAWALVKHKEVDF